jgi:hypothetical protein
MLLDQLSEDISIRIRKKPFRHIIIDNVFKRDVYRSMCKGLDERLERSLVQKSQSGKFWKFDHYDAYCYNICPEADSVYGDIVYSPDWRKFINGFFQHNLTKNVLAELHHHRTDSESGYIHNDYDIASFAKEPLDNGTNAHRQQINYRGRTKGAVHCVRSIAVLYYFQNQKWYDDFGGETAFYPDHKEGTEPVKRIPPVSNRLVAFEVSPISYHSFINNRMMQRNSLVMWFHSPEKWATKKYGQEPKNG